MNLQDAKVLVTGADGFIGSHLVEALVAEKAQVRALVCYNSFNSWGWLDDLPRELLDRVEVIPGDIRDPHCVKRLMSGIDVAMHLAALIAIPYSYTAPDSYVDTNIKGTLHVLQAALEQGTKKVLVTSTSEVYGTAQYVPIDEKHPLQGQSPYSATKIGADRIAEAFYRSFGLPVTIVRPFNTYGPRQSARAVIPTIISQLAAGLKRIKLGALSPTRDFVFVQDTVQAFLQIAKTDNLAGEEINIATQTEISIGELANRIMLLMDVAAEIESDEIRLRPKDSEVERLLGSNEKIKRLVGWKPAHDLNDGLAQTISWFKANSKKHSYKVDLYNV